MAADTSRTFFKRKDVLISLLIIIATGIVYVQTANHEFINLDDSLQLTANSHVQSGISWENIKWSFTPESPCSPLTWFMYTVLFSIFGMNAGAYHMVSAVFHIMSSLLLFFTLKSITGQLWKSAFVGAVFALHPINVESVAWIAELNNVMSAFFWVLTILVYSRYAQKPGILVYLLTLLVFTLGLLAKPILMTLPFVLLLLDYWPLGRISFGKSAIIREAAGDRSEILTSKYMRTSFSHLIMEKIPFFLISAASILSTLFMVQSHTTFTSLGVSPISLRIANALVSYTKYLGKMFWPHDLAVLYPYPDMIPWWQIAGAFVLLLGVTILALRSLNKYPYFIVGWLWFVGTLVPFLGIIQGGAWPEMADRYAYVTFIGIYILFAWGIPDLVKRLRFADKVVSFSGVAVLIILMAVTWNQLGYWKNSITLFEHVLRVNKACYTAHVNLGNAFADIGHKEKATTHYLEVLKVNPEQPDAHFNLGVIFDEKGKTDEAIYHYSKCLQADPSKSDVIINLGNLFESKGQIQEAVDQYLKAIQIDPGSAEAHNNLGNIMLKQGNIERAINNYETALEIRPDSDEIHNNLGTAYVRKGELDRAKEYFSEALKLNPDNTEAYNNLENVRQIKTALGNSIATLKALLENDSRNPLLNYQLGELYRQIGNSEEAITHYRNALSVNPGFLQAQYGMVTIYSNDKRYDEAIDALEKMREIAPENADVYYNIACVRAKQGKIKDAIYWLEQAVRKGFQNWDLIRSDPDLDTIRDTEYFKKLMMEK